MIADERIPLRVVVPNRIYNTPASPKPEYIFTSNVVETVPAFVFAAVYSLGARVQMGAFIYESLVGSNNGNTPATSPAQWALVGRNEAHKPFDLSLNTSAVSTSAPGTILYTLEAEDSLTVGSDTVIAFCENAATVRVRVFEAVTLAVVYDRTISMVDTSVVVDAWTYFYANPEYFRQAVFEDVPAHVGYDIEVTVSGTVSPAVGLTELVVGKSRDIGNLTSGGRIGIEDYSRKERDTFGNFNVIQRAYSDFVDFGVMLGEHEVDGVRRYLAAIRARPCVYHAGQENVARGLIAYGFFKDLAIEFTSGPIATCTLSIEGLT